MEAHTPDGLTAALAARGAGLGFEDLPPEVVELARDGLIDWFGVTLAGSGEPGPEMLAGTLGADRAGTATVIGRGLRMAPRDAALVNGTASHVLDFDDVDMTIVCHVSAAVLGGALALAEHLDASGAELIVAYVAGYETAWGVAAAIGPQPYLRGLHPTGTAGAFGAAAACSRLLGLDAGRTATALGIAASGASGLKCNFGTMTKSLHAGSACATGLLAAQLAGLGFTASVEAVEADQGFAAVCGGGCEEAAALSEPPGGWHLLGNLFKFHAACYYAHSAIEGVAALRREHGLTAEGVRAIRLHVGAAERSACVIPAPASGLEVKFSIAHLAAMALLGRETTVIEDAAAADGETIALRERVVLAEDGEERAPTRVEIELADGSVLSAARDVNEPERDPRLRRARLQEKFGALAGPVLGDQAAGLLLAELGRLEHAPVRRVTAAAAGRPRAAPAFP